MCGRLRTFNPPPQLVQNSVLVIFAINNIFRFIPFTKLYIWIFFQFWSFEFPIFFFQILTLEGLKIHALVILEVLKKLKVSKGFQGECENIF